MSLLNHLLRRLSRPRLRLDAILVEPSGALAAQLDAVVRTES